LHTVAFVGEIKIASTNELSLGWDDDQFVQPTIIVLEAIHLQTGGKTVQYTPPTIILSHGRMNIKT